MPTFENIAQELHRLGKKRVLVGPSGDHPGSTFDNVSRGYVFEYGSPATNMPPRPHLVPGVEAVQPQIIARMTAGALAAISGKDPEPYLMQAGQIAVNSVKDMITAKLAPPIQPESYLARQTGRAGRVRRARKQGVSMIELARSEAPAATPLVDTGNYRDSITFVVRDA